MLEIILGMVAIAIVTTIVVLKNENKILKKEMGHQLLLNDKIDEEVVTLTNKWMKNTHLNYGYLLSIGYEHKNTDYPKDDLDFFIFIKKDSFFITHNLDTVVKKEDEIILKIEKIGVDK